MPVKASRLNIVLYPHPVLREKAKPIGEITEEVRDVASRMIELMHEAKGVGLASPQVGFGWRLFVANPTGHSADDRVFINPVLSEPSDDAHVHNEGCLSIPDVHVDIRRPTRITIEAIDLAGASFSLTSDDLPARIWQHEVDHLNGVLIIDRMTPIDAIAHRRVIKELEARFEDR